MIFNAINATLSFITIGLIRGLRPLLGPAVCRFTITCTNYAVLQLQQKPFFPACYLIIERLLLCNPLW
jgi:putative component of membrane protein insertase Oxa1/YidC/SpoIIIJ protein YidD